MKKLITTFFISIISLMSFSQKIEKGIINNSYLYLIQDVYKQYFLDTYFDYHYPFLKRQSLVSGKKPSFREMYSENVFSKMHYPYCWDIYKNYVYPIAAHDGTGSDFGIFRLDIIEKDTATYLRKKRELHDSLKQIYKTEEAYKKYLYNVLWEKERKKSNSRSVPVIYKLMDMLKGDYNDFSIEPGMVCYDFCVLDSVTMEFYVRGIKQFTRWLYHYPPSYKAPSEPKNWEELITYSADTLGSYPYLEENMWILHWPDSIRDDPRAQKKFNELYKAPEDPYTDKEYVPSGRHHRYRAIDDSLFFEGHFRIVPQGEERFVINTQHGAIYWLEPEKIHKIGQIQMDQYLSLNGKKIYIEDTDNNRIILFAPVEWQAEGHPRPRVRVMDKEEMEEQFEYVLE